MKKLYYIFILNLFLSSSFSQEYGYLLVHLIDAEKTVSYENGQLINKSQKYLRTLMFSVF